MSIICAIDLFTTYQTIYLQYPDGRRAALGSIELEDVAERLVDLTRAYPEYDSIILTGVQPYVEIVKQEIQLILPTAKVQIV